MRNYTSPHAFCQSSTGITLCATTCCLFDLPCSSYSTSICKEVEFKGMCAVKSGKCISDGHKSYWHDGVPCAKFVDCDRCFRPATLWYGGGLAPIRCGIEPWWEDGDYCLAGTSCNVCKNQHTWWYGIGLDGYRCGSQPKWEDGTYCVEGTSCHMCKNSYTWWWAPSMLGYRCGKEGNCGSSYQYTCNNRQYCKSNKCKSRKKDGSRCADHDECLSDTCYTGYSENGYKCCKKNKWTTYGFYRYCDHY